MEEKATRRHTSTGKCNLCGRMFAKAAMTRHIQSCWTGQSVSPTAAQEKRREERLLLITVGGRYDPDYWLHLEVPAAARLVAVDRFLRDIWLECCGHMSAFSIEGERYYSGAARDLGGRTMNFEIGRVLAPGDKAFYEYDFGSTTELTLKVTAERKGLSDGKSIRLLARNDPPAILCQSCGKPATQVCTQCMWEGDGWLWDECVEKHECDEGMFLSVVNSPRVGVCGYSG
ncbi:MAG: hypothetical protein HYX94_11255 [Chloroflexi bacterium]|nr:hypothetical protein [Chloroflexota bacterium]